jgi:hypothetical protein
MSDSLKTPAAFSPEKQHRREVFWQVYLPAFLGGVVFVGLCVWVVLFTIGYIPENLPDHQSPPAKVAVIWLLLPSCLGGLLQLALLGGTVYLLARGIHGLPVLSHKILAGVNRAAELIQMVADRAAAPVIKVASTKAGWDRVVERLAFWRHSAQGD